MNGSEWVDVPRAQRFEFKTKGAKLTGQLLAVEPVQVEGEVKNQIVIEAFDGGTVKQFTFLESADMKRRIPAENIGKGILVEYQGDSDTVGVDKGNAMKLFRIAFKDLPKKES